MDPSKDEPQTTDQIITDLADLSVPDLERVLAESERILEQRAEGDPELLFHDNHYKAWPTALRIRNRDDIVVVYSGGRKKHVDPYGRIEMVRSFNQGQSWTHPKIVYDGPIDDRDPGIMETAKRTLLLTWQSSLRYTEEKYWKEEYNNVHKRMQDNHSYYSRGWMMRSTDNGHSWSAPYRTLHAPHGPIQLSNGELLYYGKSRSSEILLARSIDDGVHWEESSFTEMTGIGGEQYSELHAVETDLNGRIILHIRCQPEGKEGGHSYIVQAVCSNYGKKAEDWHSFEDVSTEGEHPSHLMRMRNGRLVFTTCRRLPEDMGVYVRYSDDHGKSWSDEKIVISDDGAIWDIGYPSTVQLPGHNTKRMLTIWYDRPNAAAQAIIRKRHWRFEE